MTTSNKSPTVSRRTALAGLGAGALGVAIIGSIMNSVNGNKMADPTAGLPAQAAEPAQDSVGAALVVAGQVGGAAGDALETAARTAFVDAMGVAALVAAAVALAGGIVVARWLPAGHVAAKDVSASEVSVRHGAIASQGVSGD